MFKKLMMACMAIAAFAAFVIAPAASASPVLTHEGTAVAVHPATETCEKNPSGCIEGKNTEETLFTGAFNVHCNTAVLKGWVTQNNGSQIKGTIPVGNASFTSSGGDCTSALGATKVTVTSELCIETVVGSDNATTTGCGSNVVFDLEVTGTGNCKYSTASVSGTFKTNAGATINISEQEAKKVEGGFFCPSSGKLDMDFDLYTLGGKTQLTIS